jgi:hypothetical protein
MGFREGAAVEGEQGPQVFFDHLLGVEADGAEWAMFPEWRVCRALIKSSSAFSTHW